MTGGVPNRNIFLTGFMGAGKSSVGRILARRLGWSFRDLDSWIEEREQRKIAAIFTESGELAFREIESMALKELLSQHPHSQVVALGGGTFVQARNRLVLQDSGALTVLLDAPLEELKRRCQSDETVVRPLASREDEFENLFAGRREAYGLAQMKVSTSGKDAEAVAIEIEQLLRSMPARMARSEEVTT